MVDKSDNSCYYILRTIIGVIDMKISSKTVLYTMRIVGSTIIMAALGLMGYLAWITSRVGLDGFLVSGLSLGVICSVVGGAMIYFSFRIAFEDDIEMNREEMEKREKKHIQFKKCG